MENSVTNADSCFDTQEIGSLPACRQAPASDAISNKVSAVERIRVRLVLLESYIPDSSVPQDEATEFRGCITGLPGELKVGGKCGTVLIHAHRKLRDLEDRIYIPVCRMATEQFDQLHREEPDMTGDVLLETLPGDEIGEYQTKSPEASKIATLATFMRSLPRVDILISMIHQRNDEHTVAVSSWCPLELPLQGVQGEIWHLSMRLARESACVMPLADWIKKTAPGDTIPFIASTMRRRCCINWKWQPLTSERQTIQGR